MLTLRVMVGRYEAKVPSAPFHYFPPIRLLCALFNDLASVFVQCSVSCFTGRLSLSVISYIFCSSYLHLENPNNTHYLMITISGKRHTSELEI